MDNPVADGLSSWQGRLEQRSEVLRPFRMDAKMLTVRALEDSPRETRMLVSPCARSSDASASPTPRRRQRLAVPERPARKIVRRPSGGSGPALLGLPLKLIEPIVQILLSRM